MKHAATFAALLLMVAAPAYSGYFATGLTGSTKVGISSICYLTPSMAANSLYSATGFVVLTSLSLETGAGYFNGASWNTFTFSITGCDAAPAATALPIFVGSTTDPVISSGIYGGGSGGTSGGSATIDPLNPTMAIEDSLALWALGMVFLAMIWALKAIAGLFTRELS
jgi:hypothetical protein